MGKDNASSAQEQEGQSLLLVSSSSSSTSKRGEMSSRRELSKVRRGGGINSCVTSGTKTHEAQSRQKVQTNSTTNTSDNMTMPNERNPSRLKLEQELERAKMERHDAMMEVMECREALRNIVEAMNILTRQLKQCHPPSASSMENGGDEEFEDEEPVYHHHHQQQQPHLLPFDEEGTNLTAESSSFVELERDSNHVEVATETVESSAEYRLGDDDDGGDDVDKFFVPGQILPQASNRCRTWSGMSGISAASATSVSAKSYTTIDDHRLSELSSTLPGSVGTSLTALSNACAMLWEHSRLTVEDAESSTAEAREAKVEFANASDQLDHLREVASKLRRDNDRLRTKLSQTRQQRKHLAKEVRALLEEKSERVETEDRIDNWVLMRGLEEHVAGALKLHESHLLRGDRNKDTTNTSPPSADLLDAQEDRKPDLSVPIPQANIVPPSTSADQRGAASTKNHKENDDSMPRPAATSPTRKESSHFLNLGNPLRHGRDILFAASTIQSSSSSSFPKHDDLDSKTSTGGVTTTARLGFVMPSFGTHTTTSAATADSNSCENTDNTLSDTNNKAANGKSSSFETAGVLNPSHFSLSSAPTNTQHDTNNQGFESERSSLEDYKPVRLSRAPLPPPSAQVAEAETIVDAPTPSTASLGRLFKPLNNFVTGQTNQDDAIAADESQPKKNPTAPLIHIHDDEADDVENKDGAMSFMGALDPPSQHSPPKDHNSRSNPPESTTSSSTKEAKEAVVAAAAATDKHGHVFRSLAIPRSLPRLSLSLPVLSSSPTKSLSSEQRKVVPIAPPPKKQGQTGKSPTPNIPKQDDATTSNHFTALDHRIVRWM